MNSCLGVWKYSRNISILSKCVKSAVVQSSSLLKPTPCLGRVKHFSSFQSNLYRKFIHNSGTRFTTLKLIATGITGGLVIKLCLQQSECSSKFKLSHKSQSVSTKESAEEKMEIPPQFDWSLFLQFVLPDLWLIILASLSAVAVALINIKLPLFLGDLVDVVSKFTAEVEGVDYIGRLREPVVKLLGAYGLQAGLTFLYITLLSTVGERLAARMRSELFSSLVKQDIAFFDAHKTGELINRLTADVQDFKSSFKQIISQGLKSTTQTIGCVISLYFVSPQLTGILLVLMPLVIGSGSIIGHLLRKMSRRAQEQVATATAVADEALGNVRTVRAFAMEDKEINLYTSEVNKSVVLNELLGVGIGMFQGLSNFAINGFTVVVLYAGGTLLATNQLRPGDLMSFLVATQTIQRSLGNISILLGQTVRGLSAGARVMEYILIKPTIPMTGGITLPEELLNGNIEFQHVKFQYPTRSNQTVLQDFSLVIPAGKMVALCGLSGAGKSTVAALIERFYDIEGGKIILDGHDLRELDPSWLRGHAIGYINQEPVLFATTIIENIRYGRPDATNEEVFEASRQANAHAFIERFPKGYNTVLGERGVTVSGGQRQRIAIARALLKNPAILILDEATSALDAESERLVQEALDKLTTGRTVVVIAHRLSTIQDADKIVVLSGGKIKEMGTHQELLKKQGAYADLIRRQTNNGNNGD